MNDTKLIEFQNPPGFEVDFNILQDFEANLDPQTPESCTIPCHVLGYGEISTVFEIKVDSTEGLIAEEIGIKLPPHGHAIVKNPSGRPIFYILQFKLPAAAIGNNAIHLLNRQGVLILFERVLQELNKLWSFNHRQSKYQVSLDGQISNWVIKNFDPDTGEIDPDIPLSYVDTSTPVYQVDGVEQFDPELVLRTTPRLLAAIIRQFFLEDVMTRYYDPRKVVVDILANFHKEGRPDLIPELTTAANRFFADGEKEFNVEPIQEQEIRDYYREDAFIWSFLSSTRRLDRFLYLKILRREYPYILPGKVER
jgi:hypothetical protein